MKLLLLPLILGMLATNGYADGINNEQEYDLNTKMGRVAAVMKLGTKLKQAATVMAVYDIAAAGKNNGSSTVNSGVHGLGVSLPKDAVIVRSWLHIKTAFTSSGSVGTSTIAIHCEDANNIKTATDLTITAADALLDGASTDTLATFVKGIAAKCEITATISSPFGDFDTGKANIFVDYEISP